MVLIKPALWAQTFPLHFSACLYRHFLKIGVSKSEFAHINFRPASKLLAKCVGCPKSELTHINFRPASKLLSGHPEGQVTIPLQPPPRMREAWRGWGGGLRDFFKSRRSTSGLKSLRMCTLFPSLNLENWDVKGSEWKVSSPAQIAQIFRCLRLSSYHTLIDKLWVAVGSSKLVERVKVLGCVDCEVCHLKLRVIVSRFLVD